MIKRLRLKNCFTHQNEEFRFSSGLTAITGPNESGKSLILEMIRYALFGTKALRGVATGYRNLEVDMDFCVSGHEYTVSRAGSRVVLKTGDREDLASGTTAVNARIIQILGYDLTVFDVANICNQGNIEALSNMKPAERKAMVDQTIGLTALDSLASWIGELENVEKKTAFAIEEGLVKPVHPVEPSGYEPSGSLAQMQEVLAAEVTEFNELRGWLSAAQPGKPGTPSCHVGDTSGVIETHEDRRLDIERQKKDIWGELVTLCPALHTAEEMDAFEVQIAGYRAYVQAQYSLSQMVKPPYTVSELNKMTETWGVIFKHEELRRALSAMDDLKDCESQDCPKCGHTFPTSHHEIERARKQIASMDTLKGKERPEDPPLMPVEIEAHLQQYSVWTSTYDDRCELEAVEEVADPGITLSQLEDYRGGLADEARRVALHAELNAFEVLEDRTEDLRLRRQYEFEMREFQERMARYDEYVAKRVIAERRSEELEGCILRLETVRGKHLAATIYEAAVLAFEMAIEIFDSLAAKVQEHRSLAAEYLAARKAIKQLKVKVKSYLVPSLNRVASHLLSQMTSGARSVVNVDKDFNIEVDGQPIGTLSGSGKAVANLAIRIALGQVLTNKVFSVFMGDEIDASMDNDRAGHTAECLRGLVATIGQVVIVTHKSPDADHHIQL